MRVSFEIGITEATAISGEVSFGQPGSDVATALKVEFLRPVENLLTYLYHSHNLPLAYITYYRRAGRDAVEVRMNRKFYQEAFIAAELGLLIGRDGEHTGITWIRPRRFR